MKKLFITPAIYTVLTYGLIRMIDDPYADQIYFLRASAFNIITEFIALYFMFLLIYRLLNLLKIKFNKLTFKQLSGKTIAREFSFAVLICLACINFTAIPFLTVSFDGLQLWDVVEINLIPVFVVMLHYSYSRLTHYINLFINSSVEMERVKNEHLATELKFLKGQIQPHFLFNSLNTVYFQMDESVEAAKKTIEKLSKLLRYRLYEHQEDQTTLNEEFEYLENYIDLQNTRYSGQLQVKVLFDKSVGNKKIYPFLMIPLVENAFKYIGGKNLITIEAKPSDGKFIFTISNSVDHSPVENNNKGGIGIENLSKRLQLLYPEQHELKIDKNTDEFKVRLTIYLK